MKFLSSCVLVTLLLSGQAFSIDGFDFQLGPFNIEFNPVGREYQVNYGSRWEPRFIPNSRAFLDTPICYAISNFKKLELVVELHEYINKKEKKVLISKLIVEPYVFGFTHEGNLDLKGKIVTGNMLKEVRIKYGIDRFVDPSIPNNKNDEVDENEDESDDYTTYYDTGYYKGKYSSEKYKGIDIRRIRRIQVIEDSFFEIPKNYKQDNRDFLKIICQLPVEQESRESKPTR